MLSHNGTTPGDFPKKIVHVVADGDVDDHVLSGPHIHLVYLRLYTAISHFFLTSSSSSGQPENSCDFNSFQFLSMIFFFWRVIVVGWELNWELIV